MLRIYSLRDRRIGRDDWWEPVFRWGSGEHTTYQKGGGAKLTHAHESEQFASLLNRIELKNAAEDKW